MPTKTGYAPNGSNATEDFDNLVARSFGQQTSRGPKCGVDGYVDGLLGSQDRLKVERHIASCMFCFNEIADEVRRRRKL